MAWRGACKQAAAMDDLLFRALTPFGLEVFASRRYWLEVVLAKHPILRDQEERVRDALEDPQLVRRSRTDPSVLLFYRVEPPRWLCAVAKMTESGGFLITAYPTDGVKIGELAWPPSH